MLHKIKYSNSTLKFYHKDTLVHYGICKVSWFKQRKILSDPSKNEILRIKTKIGFNGIRHIINFKNDLTDIILKLKGSLSKNYYECIYKKDEYRIICHRGHNTSIFKNGEQIAYYSKKSSAVFSAPEIQLISNSDINFHLIFSFILSLEISYQDKNEAITLDLGNVGGEFKPFNEKWTPRN
ncbi:hypothetical protein [Tenacibaculum maritimum]|uniref:hypothetical protein n=1 Tax=Tenacibaculum maritimum TaxID=107401 RepID=UPI0012E4AEBF|nr:hypothetical protein [Tenacibaculum maritimum]CAA0190096.1 hypothetical protein TMP445_380002 [Tenacibaculum maritimum]